MSSATDDLDAHLATYHAFVRGLRYAVAAALLTLILLAWWLL